VVHVPTFSKRVCSCDGGSPFMATSQKRTIGLCLGRTNCKEPLSRLCFYGRAGGQKHEEQLLGLSPYEIQ
jgi:hypothetical protein